MNYVVNKEVADKLIEAGYVFGEGQSDMYQLHNIYFFLLEYAIDATAEYKGDHTKNIDETTANFYPVVTYADANGYNELEFNIASNVSYKEAVIIAIEHAVEQLLQTSVDHHNDVHLKEEMIRLSYKKRESGLTAEEEEKLTALQLQFPIEKVVTL